MKGASVVRSLWRAVTPARALLFIAVVVTLWLPFVSHLEIRHARMVAMIAILLGVAAVYLADCWPARLLGAWCAASFLFVSDDGRAMVALMAVTGCLALYAAAGAHVTRGRVWSWLVVVALAQTGYQALQVFGVDPVFAAKAGRGSRELWVGWTGQVDVLACIQALALPGAFRRGWRWSLPVLVAGLLMSGTATGYAAALAGSGAWLWTLRPEIRLHLAGAVGAVACAGAWFSPDTMSDARWTVWQQAIADSTFAGHGLGSFAVAGYTVPPLLFRQAHNEYVQILYELGAVGLLLALAWIVVRARSLRADPLGMAALATFAVLCAGLFPLHAPEAALWSVLLLGAKA